MKKKLSNIDMSSNLQSLREQSARESISGVSLMSANYKKANNKHPEEAVW